jgi:hypothetical protein
VVPPEIRKLRVGQILRDSTPKRVRPSEIDGLVNFYAATCSDNGTMVPFSKGINPIAQVRAAGELRRPGLVIASSPHKSGSLVTPWQDHFAPDEGYVRYFGDQRTPGQQAGASAGNRLLIDEFEQFHSHSSPESRVRATPLLFFRRVIHNGTAQGFPQFQGFGVITGVRLVSQFNEALGEPFANFEFECAVLDLAAEGEVFDWEWINARRTKALSTEDTHARAPTSWRRWAGHGLDELEAVRRRVLRRRIAPVTEQVPPSGSPERKLLNSIHAHYDGKKRVFESLASAIAARVLSPTGVGYKTHGLTKGSGDFGIDFVGQLDIGEGFSRTALVVLGQAKCIKPTRTANAADIARTVARLRRGWLGAFVTTGAFSEPSQKETYEDRYPIVLIPGSRVADEVKRMLHEEGHEDLERLLDRFDEEFEVAARIVDPERLIA